MNIRKLFSYLCLVMALFSLGSLKKQQDPIAATEAQTGPISLKQKLEETKDGVKGAPSPSMKFYGSEKVLTSSPVKDSKGEEEETAAPAKSEEEAVEEDESWEAESAAAPKKGQESAEKAVEDEDDWWSEDVQTPPPDAQSGNPS